MSKFNEKSRQRKIDPDPFMIACLIVAAIAMAANVYSTAMQVSDSGKKRKQQAGRRRAVLLRWQADLAELRDVMTDLRSLLEELRARVKIT